MIIFSVSQRLCKNRHKICVSDVCIFKKMYSAYPKKKLNWAVTKIHMIHYRGKNQLDVLEMPPDEVVSF